MNHESVQPRSQVPSGRVGENPGNETGIGGGSREGAQGAQPPPLFLDQTEARRAEKFFDAAPSLSHGLDDRPPHPYLKVWIRHC